MRFPELASNQRYAQSAHVLSYPSAYTSLTGEAGHWHVLLRSRAIENQCYVIAAAQVCSMCFESNIFIYFFKNNKCTNVFFYI